MYDPCTQVYSFPPYPGSRLVLHRTGKPPRRTFGEWLYAQSSWLGFTIWHIDPEKPGTGNRRDDSCGWFDRTPGEYNSAVKDLLADKDMMQQIENTKARAVFWKSPWFEERPEDQRGWNRVTPADAMAIVLTVGQRLESTRQWHANRNKPWWKPRAANRDDKIIGHLIHVALNPADNLATFEDGESLVRLLAAFLNRQFASWWEHPRWHVHHWQLQFNIRHSLRRMFTPCAGCGKRLGWAYCPLSVNGEEYHHDCYDKQRNGQMARHEANNARMVAEMEKEFASALGSPDALAESIDRDMLKTAMESDTMTDDETVERASRVANYVEGVGQVSSSIAGANVSNGAPSYPSLRQPPITRDEITARGIDPALDGAAIDVCRKLGWPDESNPFGTEPTHRLVEIGEDSPCSDKLAEPDEVEWTPGVSFRKKPVVIEAVKFQKIEDGLIHWEVTPDMFPEWLMDAACSPEGDTGSIWVGTSWNGCTDPQAIVGTLEGGLVASPGDWIIRGVKGEIYPCKPDIFEAIYDAVPPARPVERIFTPEERDIFHPNVTFETDGSSTHYHEPDAVTWDGNGFDTRPSWLPTNLTTNGNPAHLVIGDHLFAPGMTITRAMVEALTARMMTPQPIGAAIIVPAETEGDMS